ncbi:uncharacterized protein Dwil_GK22587 [Drosophila willistoni]|uniref:CHHC U11-48K-type domain-containing protein n=1 Tax=Drosophila willistoni TaxID=7260 RepID=B4NF65_DROWI|nr:gametocyte-specific factor 1 homolog [Drosophila willistoni]EDW82932.2 uncharacterized protein Dwil_GK22587 [Drosophila willistoni]
MCGFRINSFVQCPFDTVHRILPTRLVLHLNRCARNYSGLKMVRCPFDITHVVRVSEMEAHVATCPSRKIEELEVDQLPRAPDPSKKETSENLWDDEPEVPAYDPSLYCAANPVVRTLYGATASERREFREQERARFRAFRKASKSAGSLENTKSHAAATNEDEEMDEK